MQTIREFAPADRYTYDFGPCKASEGFAQVDTSQDASYFGTWANPFKLAIVNYCEGDVTTTICDKPSEFVAQLEGIVTWNRDNGHEFKGIDGMCNAELIAGFDKLGLAHLMH